jgi:hypothetical protein
MVATAPLITKLPTMTEAPDGPWRWLILAFPTVGVALILALAYEYVRRQKYGESVLQLAATPGIVGGQLAGVVRIPRIVQAENGFRIKLSCIETRASGRKNETRDEVLWQDEQLVVEPMREIATGATAVPVLFAIPYEAKETSHGKSKREIKWQLNVTARMSGVDYKSRFEVPVFKTSESRPDFQLKRV